WSRLDRSDGERLELLVLVGFYALMGGLTNALRLELDDPYV
ncbi:MAG: hypothetical protein JWO90_1774, partial [Solirubrobacterales bacterium]|nr:hypothetical protein [Solirubrobacterales bacterium]